MEGGRVTAERRHIMLAAGGTGGHMMPAEATARLFLQEGHRVTLVTDERGNRFAADIPDLGKIVLNTASHMHGGIAGKIKAGISILRSTWQMAGVLKTSAVDVVVGFGGYPSLPAVLAASRKNIPVILHEQNSVLGRVNRWTAKRAACIALGFEKTRLIPAGVSSIFTGNPVREEIIQRGEKMLNSDGDLCVAVLGGSQGARILSEVVPAALAGLDMHLRVVHQARAEDIGSVTDFYAKAGIDADVRAYFEDMATVLDSADIIVARAGASTVAELMITATPSVLVPLKIAADNHQYFNALALAENDAAILVEEVDFTVERLTHVLQAITGDNHALTKQQSALKAMAKPDAAHHLVKAVHAVLGADARQEAA